MAMALTREIRFILPQSHTRYSLSAALRGQAFAVRTIAKDQSILGMVNAGMVNAKAFREIH